MDAFSIITAISIIFTVYATALFFNYDYRVKYLKMLQETFPLYRLFSERCFFWFFGPLMIISIIIIILVFLFTPR